MRDTLEEEMTAKAQQGLLALGMDEDTAETYAPWLAMIPQFLPFVGEGVGVDNTRDAVQEGRYGDAAIEGGLTLLGAVPVVGDLAAAAIKGIRRAPTSLLDDAVVQAKAGDKYVGPLSADKVDEINSIYVLQPLPQRPPHLKGFKKDNVPDEHREELLEFITRYETIRKRNNRIRKNGPEITEQRRATAIEKAEREQLTEDNRAAWAKENPPPESASIPWSQRAPEQQREVNAYKAAKSRGSETEEIKAARLEAERGRDRIRYADPDVQKRRSEQGRRYRQENHDEILARQRSAREGDRERFRQYGRDSYDRDPETHREAARRREGVLREQTPAHANKDAMNDIHKRARELTEATGVKYVVDHVVPLRAQQPGTAKGVEEFRTASGLNVQDNLLIIPENLNASKGPYMAPGEDPMTINEFARRRLLEQAEEGLLGPLK